MDTIRYTPSALANKASCLIIAHTASRQQAYYDAWMLPLYGIKQARAKNSIPFLLAFFISAKHWDNCRAKAEKLASLTKVSTKLDASAWYTAQASLAKHFA